jgi:putative SOS response-associated peptidase YedK
MCNRYRPASVVRIRDFFGFTYIESGPDLRYNAGIGPLQPGPFILGKELVVGQWGLIPNGAKSRKPTKKDTKPRLNNCRREILASGWHCRWAWSRGQRCLIPQWTMTSRTTRPARTARTSGGVSLGRCPAVGSDRHLEAEGGSANGRGGTQLRHDLRDTSSLH